MIKNLSKNVRILREAKGISQSGLARMAGISNDYTYRIEKLKAPNIGIQMIAALAKALKVHPSILLFGEVQEPSLKLDHEEQTLYPLKKDEKELLQNYRELPSAKEKRTARDVVSGMRKK